jgi:hypothetical protein
MDKMQNEPLKGGTRPIMFSDAALQKFRAFTKEAGIFNQFTKSKGFANDAKRAHARDDVPTGTPIMDFVESKLSAEDFDAFCNMLAKGKAKDEGDLPDYLDRPSDQGGTERSASKYNKPGPSRLGVGALEDNEYDAHDEDDEESRHELRGESDPEEEEEPGREGIEEDENPDEEPKAEKPRLGFKSNARNPERMSRANVRAADPVEVARAGRKTGEDVGVAPPSPSRGFRGGSATRNTSTDEPGAFPGRPRPGGKLDGTDRRRAAHDQAIAMDYRRRLPEMARIKTVAPYGEHRGCRSIYDCMGGQTATPIAMDSKRVERALRAGTPAKQAASYAERFPDAANIKVR